MNNFEVNSLVLFSTFTMLYNHHLYPVPNIFTTPKENFISIKQVLLILPSPYSLANINIYSITMEYLFWKFSLNGIMQYVAFCVWLLSLSIQFLRFMYVVSWSSNYSFLQKNNIPLYGYTEIYLSIYILVNIISQWTSYHLLGIVKSASMNMYVHIFEDSF